MENPKKLNIISSKRFYYNTKMEMINTVVNGQTEPEVKHCTCSDGFFCNESNISSSLFWVVNSLIRNCENFLHININNSNK